MCLDDDDLGGQTRIVDSFAEPSLLDEVAVDADDGALAEDVQCLLLIKPIIDHNIDDSLHHDENRITLVANLEKRLVDLVEAML